MVVRPTVWAGICAVAVAAGLLIAPSARSQTARSPMFTVAGRETGLMGGVREGAVSTDVQLPTLARVAAAPDGGFAILAAPGDDRVFRVDASGRVHVLLEPRAQRGFSGDGGPVAQAAVGQIADIAVGADGSVYLADEENCNVRRVAPDGQISTFAGQHRRFFPLRCEDSASDGARALQASLCRPSSLATTPDGALLIGTGCGGVWKVVPDGSIRRLAGVGSARPRDGRPALTSRFSGRQRVAAMPDGTAIVSDQGRERGGSAWRMGADGVLRLVWTDDRPFGTAAVTGLVDGSMLIQAELAGHPLLRRTPDGHVEDVLSSAARTGRDPLASAFDGDAGPLAGAPLQGLSNEVVGVAQASDGGWLLLDGRRVLYVEPPVPRRLAVGLDASTISRSLPIRVALRVTLPAEVIVRVHVRGRTVSTRVLSVPAGVTELAMPGRANRLNVVSVRAAAPGQVAGDHLGVVPGWVLPVAAARRLALEREEFLESIGGGRGHVSCRRLGLRRVDCGAFLGTCQGVTSFRLRADGALTTRRYKAGTGRRCRLRVRPHWEGPRGGQQLPT